MTNDDQLTEDEVRRVTDEQTSVTSPDGQRVSLAMLKRVYGLDHRTAIAALGFVATGASVFGAVGYAIAKTSETATAQTSTGSGQFEVDTMIANLVDTTTVEADELDGPIVGRNDPIDHIGGNWYVDSSEPSSPTDDDLLFKKGG